MEQREMGTDVGMCTGNKKGYLKGNRDTLINRVKYLKNQWLTKSIDRIFSIFFRYGPVFLYVSGPIDQFFSIASTLSTKKSLYQSGYGPIFLYIYGFKSACFPIQKRYRPIFLYSMDQFFSIFYGGIDQFFSISPALTLH